MPSVIVTTKGPPKIGLVSGEDGPNTVEITASIRETHSQRADVTDFPIESGSDLSDHRRVHPRGLVIEGIVSDAQTFTDSKIDSDGNVTSGAPEATYTAFDDYVRLDTLFNSADVFDVYTTLRMYRDVHLVSFSVTRDKTTDSVIAFSAEFRRIETAESATASAASAPPTVVDEPKATPEKNRGPQATKPATDADASAYKFKHQEQGIDGTFE